MNEEIMKYIDEQCEKLKQELIKAYEHDPKEDAPFPQVGDKYFYIHDNGYISIDSTFSLTSTNKDRLKIGNIFKTRADAIFMKEKLKVIAELKKYAEPEYREWNDENFHYTITCSHNHILPTCHKYGKCNTIYFESIEKAEEAIEAVGEDRIKKYYLGIKEKEE